MLIVFVSVAAFLSGTGSLSHAQDQTGSTNQSSESTSSSDEGNVTVNSGDMTREIVLNQSGQVEMDNLVIVSSSDNQVIDNVAYNESTVDIRLNQNGTVNLRLHLTTKPVALYADHQLLLEAPTLSALSLSHGGSWFYDEHNHVLFIFADPVHVIFRYRAPTPTPIPEFPDFSILTMLFTVFASLTLIAHMRSRKIVSPF
jgi:hypothetical protein